MLECVLPSTMVLERIHCCQGTRSAERGDIRKATCGELQQSDSCLQATLCVFSEPVSMASQLCRLPLSI